MNAKQDRKIIRKGALALAAAVVAVMAAGCQPIADLTGIRVPLPIYRDSFPASASIETKEEREYRLKVRDNVALTGLPDSHSPAFDSIDVNNYIGGIPFWRMNAINSLYADLYVTRCYLESPLSEECRRGRARIRGTAQGLEKSCNLGNGASCMDLVYLLWHGSHVKELVEDAVHRYSISSPEWIRTSEIQKKTNLLKEYGDFLALDNSMFSESYFSPLERSESKTGFLEPSNAANYLKEKGCSAAKPDPTACYNLASTDILWRMSGKDRVALLEKAADLGDPTAAEVLCRLHSGRINGPVVKKLYPLHKDPAKARHYCKLAREACSTAEWSDYCAKNKIAEYKILK